VTDALSICLVCPYALNGAHPVAGHVRDVATALAGRGHRVTVLAPSASTQALRSGRRRFRSLASGDGEALLALTGEPLAVAVGPAVPLVQRHRSRGAGIPVASNANVALAVTRGGFDIVDAHEPHVPGISAAAVKHARGITVGTFHTAVDRTLVAPIRGSRRERYRARIDALIATSSRAAERAATLYRGEYAIVPEVIDPVFAPRRTSGRAIVATWSTESRPLARALIRLVARTPGLTLTLVWDRDSRRPLRPHVPAAARGRVSAVGPRDPKELAALMGAADVAVCTAGDSRFAWEARAAGCAVVSEDGQLGLAYAPDQPPLAAAAAARQLDDEELRERLTREGADAVAERRPEHVAERLEEIYRGALGRRRAARPRPQSKETIDVDLHMHTNHSHDCATDPEALIDHAISIGLGAIAITDHNEIDGAFEAQRIVREKDKPLVVIAAEEVKTAEGEVIGLFLTEKIERGMPIDETIAEIQRQGGLVLMPHPFDRLHTIPSAATLHRLLDEIDIFEVYNSRLMFDTFNDDALRFATKYNLVQSAGSDSHVLQGLGTAINRIPAFDGPEEFLVSMRYNEIIRRPKNLLYLQGLKWVQQVSKTGA
jgi:predicted metal-dependent phosphoesterase TrpH/glycosyltransferase involved in cell wall biosynthesis